MTAPSLTAPRCRNIIRLSILLASITACAGDSIEPPPPPPAVTAFAADSTRHPLVKQVTVDLATAAAVEVTYQASSGAPLIVTSDSAQKHHQLLIGRLRPGTSYTYEVRSKNLAGTLSAASSGSFTTGPLPDGLISDVFTATGTPTMPLTIAQISTATNGWFGVVAFDATGTPVWYHRTTTGAMGFTRLSNGNIAIIDRGIVVIGPRGDTVASLPQTPGVAYGTIHHGVSPGTNGSILFIATDTKVINDTSVVGDAVWEWTPGMQPIKRWTAFDMMDWKTERTYASAPGDWLHANSVYLGPRGNAIVSFRNLDQAISIAPDWKSLEWRLGGPGTTLEVAAGAGFQGQHGVREISPGRVLMFDNGFNRPDGFGWSRAMEFSIDLATHKATKVWEYRPNPDDFAQRLGSVQRYSNGNTLVNFGWLSPNPIQIVEVTQAGQVVFKLAPAQTIVTKIYAAEPTNTLFGEKLK